MVLVLGCVVSPRQEGTYVPGAPSLVLQLAHGPLASLGNSSASSLLSSSSKLMHTWEYSPSGLLLPLPICLFLTSQEFGSTKSVPSRCDFLQNLIANGCAGAIENPRSSSSVVKNIPLSSKGSGQSHLDVTQITPQKVALSLRPGESQQLPAPWLHVGGKKWIWV